MKGICSFWRRTLHPAWFQSQHSRLPYFEGWYFKLIDASETHRYAVIPGIFRGQDPQGDHAFVQLLDGVTGQATYHRYPVEAFRFAEESFDVWVGDNHFTLEQIDLQIEDGERSVVGSLRFAGLTPWPVTWRSPGAMGWYAWVPRMECYHGVLSLDHTIHGSLTVDGVSVDFSGGRGYVEKDWGHSFPSAWVWLQTNHFEQPGTSLMLSVAVIPWLGSTFQGFIVGLWHGGTLYRFATYTGALMEQLEIEPERVRWTGGDRHHRLEIQAHRTQSTALRGPTGSDMGGRVPETLLASAEVRLTSRAAGEPVVFAGTGRNAGLEVVGEP